MLSLLWFQLHRGQIRLLLKGMLSSCVIRHDNSGSSGGGSGSQGQQMMSRVLDRPMANSRNSLQIS